MCKVGVADLVTLERKLKLHNTLQCRFEDVQACFENARQGCTLSRLKSPGIADTSNPENASTWQAYTHLLSETCPDLHKKTTSTLWDQELSDILDDS